MTARRDFFIDGDFVKSTSLGVSAVVCPSTEAVVGSVGVADAPAIDEAVAAARTAFEHGLWRRMLVEERTAALRDVAAGLRTRAGAIAELITAENGSPLASSRRVQTSYAIGLLDEAANAADAFSFDEERASRLGDATVTYEPVGVVAAISAWNGPLYLALNKVAPALAAGCTVVLKPSPEAPLDAFVLAEVIAESAVPDGVFNLVTGDAKTGELLATHADVDMVAFTGSTATGRRILRGCAGGIRRCLLELGGKSAAIILDDVELDDIIDRLVWGTTMGSGQVCFVLSRVLVPERRRAEVIDALCDRIQSLRVGDPYDESVELGPLISKRHQQRVEGYIAVRMQGRRPCGGGWGTPGSPGARLVRRAYRPSGRREASSSGTGRNLRPGHCGPDLPQPG